MHDTPQITPAAVLSVLQHHIGEANGIHVADLVRRIKGQTHTSAALERRVRQIVTELRMDGQHICGHPATGYYMAATPQELEATCEFLYQRAMTGLTQISRMKNVSLPDLRGQLHLPT